MHLILSILLSLLVVFISSTNTNGTIVPNAIGPLSDGNHGNGIEVENTRLSKNHAGAGNNWFKKFLQAESERRPNYVPPEIQYYLSLLEPNANDNENLGSVGVGSGSLEYSEDKDYEEESIPSLFPTKEELVILGFNKLKKRSKRTKKPKVQVGSGSPKISKLNRFYRRM